MILGAILAPTGFRGESQNQTSPPNQHRMENNEVEEGVLKKHVFFNAKMGCLEEPKKAWRWILVTKYKVFAFGTK